MWENGRLTSLGTEGLIKPGTTVVVPALNDKGQVLVNTSKINPDEGLDNPHATTAQRAFVSQNGRLTSLPGRVQAVAINDQGQIAGNRYLADDTPRGFIWQHGEMTDLGTLGGARTTSVVAINEHGLIIGTSGPRGFVWENGHITLLSPLPGDTRSEVAAINDRGQIVGTSVGGGPRGTVYHAVIWSRVS